jgi:hypothetical protein
MISDAKLTPTPASTHVKHATRFESRTDWQRLCLCAHARKVAHAARCLLGHKVVSFDHASDACTCENPEIMT